MVFHSLSFSSIHQCKKAQAKMFKAWASLLSFFLYTSLALSFQITESKFQNRSQIPLKYSGVCPERGDWVEHRSPQRGVWFKHHAPLKHYCCQGVKRNYPPVERARASIQTPAQKQSNIVKCHILFAKRVCHLEDDMPLRGLVRQLQLHLVTVATLL